MEGARFWSINDTRFVIVIVKQSAMADGGWSIYERVTCSNDSKLDATMAFDYNEYVSKLHCAHTYHSWCDACRIGVQTSRQVTVESRRRGRFMDARFLREIPASMILLYTTHD